MSAAKALQAAILAHLAADAGVQEQLGNPPRIHDRAPAGAAYPYVALGRGESRPLDGDSAPLSEHRLTLHVWTRRHDFGQVKSITGAIASALHNAQFALPDGWRLVLCRCVYTDHFEGADERAVHGLVRIRALVQTV
ncbi:hypothetical protein X907_2075 [Glycocaulis alkaliphilus]|uniref:Uncharacterized protein n=1 Tax=Glycocaulis alkaliphilus TaxID=1434191 RepID=A0A3T0EC00_9PROT|nr:DUF3168 domain-containing protein [Glycocaulis alkaliphilus]AZU04598.1 hypothetical protein X907_2075 [Glycocaulis alkaliphilus]GGB69202.1 hypothetical protein GCM10007417_06260 [Glycocaulis alkaliphilus]